MDIEKMLADLAIVLEEIHQFDNDLPTLGCTAQRFSGLCGQSTFLVHALLKWLRETPQAQQFLHEKLGKEASPATKPTLSVHDPALGKARAAIKTTGTGERPSFGKGLTVVPKSEYPTLRVFHDGEVRTCQMLGTKNNGMLELEYNKNNKKCVVVVPVDRVVAEDRSKLTTSLEP